MDRHVPIHKPILWIYMLRNNLERLIFLASAYSVGDSETPASRNRTSIHGLIPLAYHKRATPVPFCHFVSGTFWAYGRQAGTPIIALAVAGMNDVLNSQGYTQAAWWNRSPVGAWLLMGAVAIIVNFLLGYGTRVC